MERDRRIVDSFFQLVGGMPPTLLLSCMPTAVTKVTTAAQRHWREAQNCALAVSRKVRPIPESLQVGKLLPKHVVAEIGPVMMGVDRAGV